MFAHGEMVTIISTTITRDAYGDETTETVTYEWGPCGVAPRYATESADQQSPAVVVGKVVYGPPIDVDPADLRLDSADSLVLSDGEYEVDGLPGDWRSPFTGWRPGVEVAVKRASEA